MILLSLKTLDILEETRLMNSKSVNTPMDPNVKLLCSQRESLLDLEKYRRLVGKLNYLTLLLLIFHYESIS